MLAAGGLLLAAALVPTTSPDVYYYTNNNYDTSKPLSLQAGKGSATIRGWKTTYQVFDAAKETMVQRIDVSGVAKSKVQLWASSALSLSEGPAYIFTNASYTILDTKSGTNRSVAVDDASAWLSGGACVRLEVTIGDSGLVSLLFVSSGALDLTGTAGGTCVAGYYLVGQEMRQNWVPYNLTNPSQCTSYASHQDTPEYSNMDGPIGPLQSHYHTRGALYYIKYGSAQMNDRNAPWKGVTMQTGDLRFVNTGVYYGPEEMDQSTTFCSSVHEVDPSAIAYSRACNCEEGYDYQNDAGGESIGAVPSQEHCCGLCGASSKCAVAVYAGGACYLKYSAEGKTAKSGVVACKRAQTADRHAQPLDTITQCPFACFQKPTSEGASRCVRY